MGFLLLLGPRPPAFTRGTAGEHRHVVLNVQVWIPAVQNQRDSVDAFIFIKLPFAKLRCYTALAGLRKPVSGPGIIVGNQS